jgi:hypothetical protein
LGVAEDGKLQYALVMQGRTNELALADVQRFSW